ncbi:84_t:CDS:1, partial [Acaulospora morrowiae]
MKRTLEIDFDTIERVIPNLSKRVKFMQQVKEYNDMINGKGLFVSENELDKDESSEDKSSEDESSEDELSEDELSEDELSENELKKDSEDESDGNTKIREGKPYNSFVKERFNDVKELNPELTNQDIFRLLAIEWKS